MTIKFYNSSNNFVCEEIFILMMLPGIDMTRLFIERMIRKKTLKADKNHLHHLLLKSFNSTKFFNKLIFNIGSNLTIDFKN